MAHAVSVCGARESRAQADERWHCAQPADGAVLPRAQSGGRTHDARGSAAGAGPWHQARAAGCPRPASATPRCWAFGVPPFADIVHVCYRRTADSASFLSSLMRPSSLTWNRLSGPSGPPVQHDRRVGLGLPLEERVGRLSARIRRPSSRRDPARGSSSSRARARRPWTLVSNFVISSLPFLTSTLATSESILTLPNSIALLDQRRLAARVLDLGLKLGVAVADRAVRRALSVSTPSALVQSARPCRPCSSRSVGSKREAEPNLAAHRQAAERLAHRELRRRQVAAFDVDAGLALRHRDVAGDVTGCRSWRRDRPRPCRGSARRSRGRRRASRCRIIVMIGLSFWTSTSRRRVLLAGPRLERDVLEVQPARHDAALDVADRDVVLLGQRVDDLVLDAVVRKRHLEREHERDDGEYSDRRSAGRPCMRGPS